MKTSTVSILFFAAVLLLLSPHKVSAQSNTDQKLQDLITEVRQLRSTIMRANAASFRAMVLLERTRLHNDQIVRLTRELSDIRGKLNETRAKQIEMTSSYQETEQQVERGLRSEKELKSINNGIDRLKLLEQNLMGQEAQSSAELESERMSLIKLNKELDELQQEFMNTSESDETQQKKK